MIPAAVECDKPHPAAKRWRAGHLRLAKAGELHTTYRPSAWGGDKVIK